MIMLQSTARRERVSGALVMTGATTAALAATATWVAYKARRAEQANPPRGRFVTVGGARVHYLERGQGTPIVLLHGNVVHAEDFVVSGLMDRLAQRHRVIAFDRPGFGHSERTRDRVWTARAQAQLIHEALVQLGITQAVALGHSWGTLVALELALQPGAIVQKLVLVSGYYFPTARLDVAIASPAAIPLLGDILRYTLSPLIARLTLNQTIKRMFGPQSVPGAFLPALSREMLVRPVQIRANAEDAAFMIPAAAALSKRYAALEIPAVIFAGAADPIVDPVAHAHRLHAELKHSELQIIPGAGHMAHHASPAAVAAAVTSDSLAQ